jgi:hypothetical protein
MRIIVNFIIIFKKIVLQGGFIIVVNGSRRYKGRKKYVLLRETFARILVNTIGVDSAERIGDKLVIIGLLGAFISFIFLVILNYSGKMFLYSPYDFYIFAFFIVMGLIGAIVFSLPADYYKLTRCNRCNHDFAYKEDCAPDVREITAINGDIIRYTTRTYKCSYCGDLKKVREKLKMGPPINYADKV